MDFTGVLPEDAPDPRVHLAKLLERMPIPVMGFAGQSALDETDVGANFATDSDGYSSMTASISATLWRNPDDKSDPANLAEMDDSARRAIDEVPPWPRPAWLVERVEMMRYPSLWEVVQTHWYREESELSELGFLLNQHANYILMNQFREELGLNAHDGEAPTLLPERRATRPVDVAIDGEMVPGVEIDTDPFVYAVGAKLARGGTVTAVVDRENLPFITLEFATRNQQKREA
ncbi:hypothetical protein I6E52_07680 [Salinibacterium sp. NG253]|uniref:hypothetical protein n=1 Tax=Salinibacterium sp. NG253 TaxID=2792039 RepID=UPI0018CD08F4|nr:hypothetical protein [Salinibacterium sp. NG253]MBH0116726.1 hypothetical protein [Salinibacterium sp. NG253]